MPLTRDERKLIHQKSKQPTFGNGKPEKDSGKDGDISFRKVHGSGTVQYLKQDGDWVAISSSGTLPPKRSGTSTSPTSTSVSSHSNLLGLGSDDHEQYLLISGSRAMSGNLNMGTNDIGSVGALDVDGHTTLDQVTINTTDGAFSVSGGNNIQLTTTQDLDFNVTGTCDWNTSVTDWDNSSTFTLTSLDNTIIETQGTTSSAKTLSLIGGKSDFNKYGFISIESYNKIDESGDVTTNYSANGIQILANSDDTSAKHNNILIRQMNQGTKGSGYGINLKSENGIKIESENNNAGQSTSIIAQATGTIDIGLVSHGSHLSPNSTDSHPNRVKVHSIFDVETLFRPPSDGTKHSDTHYPIDTSTHSVKFDQIDTFKLLRATTFLASRDALGAGTPITIVDGDNDDNQKATVWRVTVFWEGDSIVNTRNFQVWHCYAEGAATADLFVLKDVEVLTAGYGGTLTWTSTSSGGLKWTNDHASVAVDVKASALKIQSGDDF